MANDPHRDSVSHSQSDGNVPSVPHKNSERGYKYEDRKSGNFNDIANTTSPYTFTPDGTSQANGASQGQISGSHGNHDLRDNDDLISKMLQATTSHTDCSDESSPLPQRSESRSCVTMESTDLLSVDA